MKTTPLKQTIGQIMHTIEFDTHTEQALSRLAAIAGKEPDQIIKDLVADYIDEQEDITEAQYTLARIDSGKESATPWETGLLPSMESFRQGLPLQPMGAGEFCRAMREAERF
jgi:predicted DNA-binding protein